MAKKEISARSREHTFDARHAPIEKTVYVRFLGKWEAVSTSNHFQNHFQVTSAAVTRRGDQSRLLIGARGK